MLINEREVLKKVLITTADALDIPQHVYEDATIKYEDVGEHLSADDSALNMYNPQIYPQGSFRLGTVVQPMDSQTGYDIDLVCLLEIPKENITQDALKSKVGDRLKERADLEQMLEPSRRCWVLKYPSTAEMPNFHMDVLPSIPNVERPISGILVTDTDLVRWQKSNPIAYAEWFKSQMSEIFERRKSAFAESIQANIEDVPDWKIKTPLQRTIQILKRHRDVYFGGDDKKPVSIILTTLAAHAYAGQEDIFDALTDITNNMPSFIENRNGVWWVENPVDPDENFADKWNEYPERRDAFFDWLRKVKSDFENLSKAYSANDGLQILTESMGQHTIGIVSRLMNLSPGEMSPNEPMVPALADDKHAQVPKWPVRNIYEVTVKGHVYMSKRGGKKGRYLRPLADSPVPKDIWIKFKATTNAPPPYSIEWQVVNTGKDAINHQCPRGDFYDSEKDDVSVRWESTSYTGTHWVEAFIINQNGVCVGRSGKVFVKVR